MSEKKLNTKLIPKMGRPASPDKIGVYSVRCKEADMRKFRYYLDKRYESNMNAAINQFIADFNVREDKIKDKYSAGAGELKDENNKTN